MANILNLPEELLRQILDHFKERGLYNDRGKIQYFHWADSDDPGPGYANFRAVQALRLVCRALCVRVLPMLAPVIRLGISSQSLYRVDQLTRNPDIAAGVRLIQVSFTYHPSEISEKSSHDRDLQLQTLKEVHKSCIQYI